jgi:hypothetical protein
MMPNVSTTCGCRNLKMPTGKTCGNCKYFGRIRTPLFQQGGRNGICEIFDYNCQTDSTYAQYCKKYKRFSKIKEIKDAYR